MEYDAFIEQVQNRAGIDRPQAEAITRATLETLGERLHPTEQQHLADQLKKELAQFVLKRKQTQSFSLEEFYTRVAARADIRYHPAAEHTRAVIDVLNQTVSPGELEDMKRRLGGEYAELFGDRPPSPLSPTPA